MYSPRDVPVKEDNVVELKATPEMCLQCFHVLVKELASSKKLSRSLSTSLHEHDETFAKAIPPTAECPLFVTWDKKKALTSTSDSFSLRGCIGTLSPRPLSTSITEYALISALRDRRFDPIKLHEVPYLRVAVSLLVSHSQVILFCNTLHSFAAVPLIIPIFIQRSITKHVYTATTGVSEYMGSLYVLKLGESSIVRLIYLR
jgi:hypothetical protein